MKKLIILTINVILLCSCVSIDYKYKWYTPSEIIKNKDSLNEGDILIVSKGSTIGTMWGHVAIINKYKRIVDFPTYGVGYNEQSLSTLSNIKNMIAIFRLKDIDDKFKFELDKEISNTKYKIYGLTFDKNFDKRLYCSQFVYIVFKNAGLNLGKSVDLDYNGGNWVMPFDIMYSPLLENINLYTKKTSQ